jgi:hypothetical protein
MMMSITKGQIDFYACQNLPLVVFCSTSTQPG